MNAATPIDFNALKSRQQSAWASGDYAVVGITLQLVGELLAEACDLRYDEKVLDVAAGNGNATLAAARRGARVTSTDYVPALLDRGAQRARAEGLTAEFLAADAEALPFEEAAFDCVLSTFGVMFAPDQARAAAELIRVCRPGGRIGLANWTPTGFIGRLFKTLGRHVPPHPALSHPRCGVCSRIWRLCSAALPQASRSPRGCSSSAIAPRPSSLKCSVRGMARCTRHSHRSRTTKPRRSKPI